MGGKSSHHHHYHQPSLEEQRRNANEKFQATSALWNDQHAKLMAQSNSAEREISESMERTKNLSQQVLQASQGSSEAIKIKLQALTAQLNEEIAAIQEQINKKKQQKAEIDAIIATLNTKVNQQNEQLRLMKDQLDQQKTRLVKDSEVTKQKCVDVQSELEGDLKHLGFVGVANQASVKCGFTLLSKLESLPRSVCANHESCERFAKVMKNRLGLIRTIIGKIHEALSREGPWSSKAETLTWTDKHGFTELFKEGGINDMMEALSMEPEEMAECCSSVPARKRTALKKKLAEVTDRVPTVLPEANWEVCEASGKIYPILAWKDDADKLVLSHRQLQLQVRQSNMLEM